VGFDNPVVPWREVERRLTWSSADSAPPPPEPMPSWQGYSRRRAIDLPAAPSEAVPWTELHCHSAYSFLDGASEPDQLVAEAIRLGLEAIAVTDHDGMYGAARLACAANMAKETGVEIGTVFGAELSLGLAARQNGVSDPVGEHLLVLARDQHGYGRLSAAISAAQVRGRKGAPSYDRTELAAAAAGHWAVLTGCRKAAVPSALAAGGPRAAEAALRALVEMFGREHVYVELVDQDQPLDDERNDVLYALARTVGVEVVATNNVHYARPRDAPLAQVLAAVRARRSLDDLAGWLQTAGTAHLRSGEEMRARLDRYPGAYETTVELGRSCVFDLRLLAPDLPPRQLGEGHSDMSWLRAQVAEGARDRYGDAFARQFGESLRQRAHEQLEHELGVIERLGFPGYFLIVHEIMQFCRSNKILAQGRGSAANSAVCYVLGITAVDPVEHGLLFERFLSDARTGPPDIDVDIANNRREEVIQHVYERYGRERAAMVANVNSYRPRGAIRDAAKALGYSPGQADAWTQHVGHHLGPQEGPRGERTPAPSLPDDTELPEPLAGVVDQMLRLPRHLSIHSGGMVLADRPIGEICPIEWATMKDRTVLQWDKEDCAFAGLVKFDLLGLGMLSALADAFALVEDTHGVTFDLHSIPSEDGAVYDMLCAADTVGVFQVESRAQMATLPRLKPRRFYDLVIEVALIRPGPIQGGSVHPFIRRKNGQEKVTYPHPLMISALERTLGVPLFQEQLMQLAMECAGFTPRESDQLRQAMSAKRSPERIARLRERLFDGMAKNGIPPRVADDVYGKLLAFASYGFPESHAYSFAYLVYASAYLKRYYPAAFTVSLLNNQPMGFYNPQSLVADARRHGVTVRGVDINLSAADATLEETVPMTMRHAHAPADGQPAIRLGLSSVRELGDQVAARIVEQRPVPAGYASIEDVVRRAQVPLAALEALATAGAFGCFGLPRREALWAVGALSGVRDGQLPGTTPGGAPPPLPPMTAVEQTIADLWSTGTSPTSHPMQHARAYLDEQGAVPTGRLGQVPGEQRVLVGGIVTHRQAPPTAGGVVFMTLEDETGMANVMCLPHIWSRYKKVALECSALLIDGVVERQDGAVNIRARRIGALLVGGSNRVRSRNFG
jgi:error-prone DNA polymerase